MDRSWKIPAGYGFLRGIVRLAVWLLFPKIRLLNRDKLAHADPTLLAVNYPESLLAAMLLVAAIDRPVLCLLSSQKLQGVFQRFISRRLGIVSIEPPIEGQGTRWLAGALEYWGAIAVFAGQSGMSGSQGASGINLFAKLVFETLEQSGERHPPAIYPIHGFVQAGDRKSGLLVYVDGPIRSESSSVEPAANSAEASQHVAAAVQTALHKNVFALAPAEIELFHRDLEDLAHEDLEEEWSRLPNWKQQAGDLELSGLVKQWIDQQNQIDSGRLVALRTLVEDYREARRRCSLGRYRIETSDLWQKSRLHVAGAWAESLLGLPIALYGSLNHALAGALLVVAGLLKNSGRRDPKVDWLLRAFVVLGCYTVQVWLFDLWLGRAAAGYYTLTLPLSGAYLWRYLRLARNRSHLLLLKVTLPGRSARLRRTRKTLLGKLEREIDLYAQSLGLPS